MTKLSIKNNLLVTMFKFSQLVKLALALIDGELQCVL